MRRATEERRFRHDGRALPTITVSVGVARLPDNGASDAEARAAVDAALYRAKHRGRNRVVSATDADKRVNVRFRSGAAVAVLTKMIAGTGKNLQIPITKRITRTKGTQSGGSAAASSRLLL